MNEPKGSRLIGAVLLVVIMVAVFIGLWAFLSMATVNGGFPSGSVVFTIGAIFLGAVCIATAVWLIRLVQARNDASVTADQTPLPPADDSTAPPEIEA
jgi:NAD/NADP transhydrogenase alpha subunit